MYWATSFCERENSSKRARMYADRAWCPCGPSAVAVEVCAWFIGSRLIRRLPPPFLHGRRQRSDDASRGGSAAALVCFLVLLMLGHDLEHDVGDQRADDRADPEECREQGQRLAQRIGSDEHHAPSVPQGRDRKGAPLAAPGSVLASRPIAAR